jgi:hypothetical protein
LGYPALNLMKCILYGNDRSYGRIGSKERLLGSNRLPMIDLLLQLAYVALALAVISLFVCTLPVWLIVLVVVLVLR